MRVIALSIAALGRLPVVAASASVVAIVAAAAGVAALPAAGGTAARGTGGAVSYDLLIDVYGEAHWSAAGQTPIEGGIDTAAGIVTAKFQGEAHFTITLDSSLRFSSRFPQEPIPFGTAFASGRLTGSWDGATGDTPDAQGGYSCSYNVSAALPGANLQWFIDGRKRLSDGAVHLSIAPAQPLSAEANGPTPTCSGYLADHARPGEGTHLTALALTGRIVKYEQALGLVKIPVKPLLGTLRSKVPIRIPKAGVAHGEGCSCPLPTLPTDLSSFSLTVKARLAPAKK